jgi:hypothetical protein
MHCRGCSQKCTTAKQCYKTHNGVFCTGVRRPKAQNPTICQNVKCAVAEWKDNLGTQHRRVRVTHVPGQETLSQQAWKGNEPAETKIMAWAKKNSVDKKAFFTAHHICAAPTSRRAPRRPARASWRTAAAGAGKMCVSPDVDPPPRKLSGWSGSGGLEHLKRLRSAKIDLELNKLNIQSSGTHFSEEHGFNEATNKTNTTYKAGSTVGEGRRAPALPRRPQPTA